MSTTLYKLLIERFLISFFSYVCCIICIVQQEDPAIKSRLRGMVRKIQIYPLIFILVLIIPLYHRCRSVRIEGIALSVQLLYTALFLILCCYNTSL